MRLLLAEDDTLLGDGICVTLSEAGYATDWVTDGESAESALQTGEYELVILDLGLPRKSGLDVLKYMRARGSDVPVLILTARDSLDDKVQALDSGADDYLCKPFEMAELMARLRVLARRLGTASSSTIEIGPVCLQLSSHQALLNGDELALTRREFMILKALMENAGRVQTRETLEDKLYGWGEEVASNTIEVHISHLRKKLPANFIQTIRGVGYTVKQR